MKLWRKLFTSNTEAEDALLHSSGATIRHRNPFESMQVPRSEVELSQEFLMKWVVPYYDLPEVQNPKNVQAYIDTCKEVSEGLVYSMLAEFGWQSRLAGAYYAAINDYRQFEDVIGAHLLKSEVCFAGAGYCVALASFGSSDAKSYLKRYLDYYLGRPDLFFDQAEALCALKYIDPIAAIAFQDRWTVFVADKSNWSLEETNVRFHKTMETIAFIQKMVKG
jgi:hypothetical protein